MNEGIEQGRMKAPKRQREERRNSTADEEASYVTRCLYKKRVQGTQELCCRWSRIQDIVSSRKPNLARGRYIGCTDIRCRLDYNILTIRRFSSVEKAELQRHL